MMNRSVGRHVLGCIGLLLLVAGVGCVDPQSLPLVAVPGSSVVVPVAPDLGKVGFGGTELSDPDVQRGSLYFRLVDENDVVVANVQARVTGVVRPASRTSLASPGQVVSLFDIPATVAPGTYELRAVNVINEQETQLGGPILLEIAELAQPPARSPQATISSFIASFLPQAVPKPAVVLQVNLALCPGCQVGALDLEVTYPHDKIDLVDALPGDGLNKALVWLDDDDQGTARIGALTLTDGFGSQGEFTRMILLVFELEEGQQPVTPPMISVTVKSASDANGMPIPPASIAVSSHSII